MRCVESDKPVIGPVYSVEPEDYTVFLEKCDYQNGHVLLNYFILIGYVTWCYVFNVKACYLFTVIQA